LVLLDRQRGKPRPWQRIASLTALAASVALAFALGWVLHLHRTRPAQDASVSDGSQSSPAATVDQLQPVPADLATPTPQRRSPGEMVALVDPFVKKMEQRGFHAQTQERLLSMQLKDGRKLDVPVQEVRLRYVRNRTY
jgi:hypothetical protein